MKYSMKTNGQQMKLVNLFIPFFLITYMMACGKFDNKQNNRPTKSSFVLGSGFEKDFTQYGGCSDVAFWAANEDLSFVMFVVADGLLTQTFIKNETQQFSWTLPHNAVAVRVELGIDITYACNDIMLSTTEVQETYVAISGTAKIEVTPGFKGEHVWEETGTGTLVLDNILLKNNKNDSDEIIIKHLEITDTAIGWRPG